MADKGEGLNVPALITLKNLNKKQYDDKIREMRNEKDLHKISEKFKKITQ